MHRLARRRLADAGVDSPELDARLIVGHFTGTTLTDAVVRPDMPVEAGLVLLIEAALSRRVAGEPVHRILGFREFHGLNLKLSSETLEPRPDTETLVDAVGGVTIEITDTFSLDGMQFEPGERTLNGEEALAYARYRSGPDGDFGRIRRQQQVLRALLSSAAGTDPITLVRNLLPQLSDHVRTDLTPAEMLALASTFASRCTEQSLVTLHLDGTVATYNDPLYNVPLSYVVVDPAEVQQKVAELMAVG